MVRVLLVRRRGETMSRTPRSWFVWMPAALALFAACSTSFQPKPCNDDTDCGGGFVCGLQGQGNKSACVVVSDAPLRIGMSAPISGPSQELGTEMKKGLLLAFDAQNA